MKKKRAESFFGIHFDFHAMPSQIVAEDFRPDLIARLLDEAKPDFVQCDTKGHAGLSSYPTDIGNRAYEIREDLLAMWRKLTDERDIALYAHHSGLFDMKIVEQHPEWAIVNESGDRSTQYLSPFSPYADEILIPQIKELYDKYRFDGVWVDGECWGAFLDYGAYACEAYFKQTGKKPARAGEDGYMEYREFCREGFRRYVDKYVKALKEYAPDFQVTSNWFYSAYMPEPISTKVDFLSGDYSCANAIESARFHTRCLEARDMTWDLMMWGQNAIPCSWLTHNRSTKELVQYCQEAAGTIAHGGAFQFFNIIYAGGGVIQEWAIPMWVKVAEFCRAREKECFGAKSVPEIGILYNEAKTSHKTQSLYTLGYPELTSLRGWINLLQDSGMHTSVLYEYQLKDKLGDYPLFIVPAAEKLNKESIDALCCYVKNGGRLIVDRKSLHFFENESGIRVENTESKLVYLDADGALAAAETTVSKLSSQSAEACAYLYGRNIYDGSKAPAALKANIEKGSMIALSVDLGDVFTGNRSTAIRNFAKSLLSSLDFEQTVTVCGETSDFVEVVLTKKGERLCVNLLNSAGPHAIAAVRSYGQIPPLYGISVKIKSETEPKEVYASVEKHKFTWSYKDGYIYAELEKLDIHNCISVVY